MLHTTILHIDIIKVYKKGRFKMKVAILVNEDTMNRCTAKGCFNAFNNKTDSFANYDSDIELVEFTHAGGNLEQLIESLIKNKVDVVHLSSCLRLKFEGSNYTPTGRFYA